MSNFEPVKLPKETIAAIESLKLQGQSPRRILALAAQREVDIPHDTWVTICDLKKVDPDTLMQALVVGWTPALTLEEELAERFKPYFEGGDADIVTGCAITLEVIAKHDPNYAHLDKWANKDQFWLVAKKEEA